MTQANQLLIGRDRRSTPTYLRNISTEVWTVLLTANTDTTLTVPSGFKLAIFSAELDFWVRADAVIPSLTAMTGTFVETDAEQNPQGFEVSTVQTALHFRSVLSNRLSVAFYEDGNPLIP